MPIKLTKPAGKGRKPTPATPKAAGGKGRKRKKK